MSAQQNPGGPETAPAKGRRCRACGVWYPDAEAAFSRSRGWMYSDCKACRAAAQKRREPALSGGEPRPVETPVHFGRICACCDQWFQDVRAAFYPIVTRDTTRYTALCRACTSERNRARYPSIRKRALTAAREWKRANPERARALSRAADARRRARAMEAGGSYSVADVEAQLEAQGGRCHWCGEALGETYEVDHFVPLSRGGSNGPENIVIACGPCNRRKGAKMPEEFMPSCSEGRA